VHACAVELVDGTAAVTVTYAVSVCNGPITIESPTESPTRVQFGVQLTYVRLHPEADSYIGRLLALLDPKSATFATLPPHFTLTTPDISAVIERVRIASRRDSTKHCLHCGDHPTRFHTLTAWSV